MNLEAIQKTYRRYAGVYDVLFGTLFEPGRRRAVELINIRPGQRILEVGVGTGLSLPVYRRDARVTGIDVSRDMLAKAHGRVAELGLTQVEALLEMDAQAMTFPDHNFDAVVAMYVASVVPDLPKLFAEMRRVCQPGGQIVVVNHFASEHPVIRQFERAVAPLSATMGFRPDLELPEFRRLAGLDIIDIQEINAFGYWKMIRFRNAGGMNGHATLAAAG
ncbi:MAG: methyltransferase domain-containing protein [Alphaproteobacteria bacterium]|nr:methyltransferase domain-containing protein [Alphaproteobacteria bacterium]